MRTPSVMPNRLANMTIWCSVLQNNTQTATEELRICLYFCFTIWVPAVVALLSSPPSGPVRRASGVASCRLEVAAPASESGAVNYSSKRRSHRAPRDVEVSKSNIVSHTRPDHQSPVSVTEFPGPFVKRSLPALLPPPSPTVGHPLWVSTWRNAYGSYFSCVENRTPRPWKNSVPRPHGVALRRGAVVYSPED